MYRKMKLAHLLKPHTRINSKCTKDLNVRPETIKTIEENIGNKISNSAHSNILLDISPQAKEIIEKINIWDYMEQKSFFMAKEVISKIKKKN